MKNIFYKCVLCAAIVFTSVCFADQPDLEKEAQMNLSMAVSADYYDSSVIYHPRDVTNGGEIVELTDGTSWLISSSHRTKTLNWWTDDIIVIKQNPNIFSSKNSLVMINLTRDVSVKCTMRPCADGYPLWITAIVEKDKLVYLSDGSIWKIGAAIRSYNDELATWVEGDHITVGINSDGWKKTPNILINPCINNWAKATRIS